MPIRIRYYRTKEPGILESVRKFKSATGSFYDVVLDLNDCTYKIRNIDTGAIYRGGEGINNIAVLKRSVKRRLRFKFKVEFDIDFRKQTRE